MTDSGGSVPEWGPQIGWLDLSSERRELIKGLYRFAAWVADHPELRVPSVEARMWPASAGEGWETVCGRVDEVAAALGLQASFYADSGFYEVEAHFGPISVRSTAISAESAARYEAETSYRGSVQPSAPVSAVAADGEPVDEVPSEADLLHQAAWNWVMEQVKAGAWPDLPFHEALVLGEDEVRTRVEARYAGGWDGFVVDHGEERREQDRRVAAWVESQQLEAAREWIAVAAGVWARVAELSDVELRAGIEARYAGGWDRFVQDLADGDDTSAEIAAGERAGGAR